MNINFMRPGIISSLLMVESLMSSTAYHIVMLSKFLLTKKEWILLPDKMLEKLQNLQTPLLTLQL